MSYDPKIHKRHSIRLKHYDYGQNGLYFITICTKSHCCRFGKVAEDAMILNDAGRMMQKWWDELAHKFEHINLYNFVVMPNHIHGVIQIDMGLPTNLNQNLDMQNHLGTHTGAPLPEIVQWFKTMTTNNYIRRVKTDNWPRFDKRLWQRNYYEHIIRSEQSYSKIADYIEGNPSKWQDDKYYQQNQ